jgi:hypothetical protein
MDEEGGPSMMTVTSRVIIMACWLALVLAPFAIDPNRHCGIPVTALVVIGVVLFAEW